MYKCQQDLCQTGAQIRSHNENGRGVVTKEFTPQIRRRKRSPAKRGDKKLDRERETVKTTTGIEMHEDISVKSKFQKIPT